MAYHVDITDSALVDAEKYVEHILQEKLDPVGAERWWNGFVQALLTLEEQPSRCPRVPEANLRTRGLRQLLYYSHRIVFELDEVRHEVRVLRVYHVSRRALRPSKVPR